MRSIAAAAGLILLSIHYWCSAGDDDHHHHVILVEDVSVEITGTSGVAFEAIFEDDEGRDSFDGVVPFGADFDDQVGFFSAVVDKKSDGAETVCVRVATPHESEDSCTTAPGGRASVTVVF